MKTIRSIIAALVAAFTLVSCSKTNLVPDQPQIPKVDTLTLFNSSVTEANIVFWYSPSGPVMKHTLKVHLTKISSTGVVTLVEVPMGFEPFMPNVNQGNASVVASLNLTLTDSKGNTLTKVVTAQYNPQTYDFPMTPNTSITSITLN